MPNFYNDTSNICFEASDFHCHTSDLQCETSDLQCETSDLQCETSDLQCETSDLQCETSDLQCETSDLQCKTSDLQFDAALIFSTRTDKDKRDEDYNVILLADRESPRKHSSLDRNDVIELLEPFISCFQLRETELHQSGDEGLHLGSLTCVAQVKRLPVGLTSHDLHQRSFV
ncbi:hypothetical protein FHG87_013261 [Trinorchestia longiramus]|nr:hypothetical protein FHG87_013261 [Trinorchestia longiramus]